MKMLIAVKDASRVLQRARGMYATALCLKNQHENMWDFVENAAPFGHPVLALDTKSQKSENKLNELDLGETGPVDGASSIRAVVELDVWQKNGREGPICLIVALRDKRSGVRIPQHAW